jgi:RND family efflux transporter MFP subunit
MQRAGIAVAPVRGEVVDRMTTVPATVTSNAYRETKVNSLVGGIVRQVRPELGAQVARGEILAVIFSNELAEAQMKYVSMQAMFQADHQKLTRTQRLVEIGAASRQELEEVTAIHEGHATEVAAARQRLLLLGLTADQVSRLQDASHVVSEVLVASPANGTILARGINPGQVVGAGQELFTVTDLSTVWVIGDLYEKDFATVRVGTPAAIVLPATPANPLRGRVAYVDPRVDPATRTAKVRVEVPNPGGTLRLGMFVQMTFQGGAGERRALVPRSAVQSIGNRTVVYVPTDEEGHFLEKVVTLGSPAGDAVQVLDGVKPGDRVVTEGSFFLRAEAARVRSSS